MRLRITAEERRCSLHLLLGLGAAQHVQHVRAHDVLEAACDHRALVQQRQLLVNAMRPESLGARDSRGLCLGSYLGGLGLASKAVHGRPQSSTCRGRVVTVEEAKNGTFAHAHSAKLRPIKSLLS